MHEIEGYLKEIYKDRKKSKIDLRLIKNIDFG